MTHVREEIEHFSWDENWESVHKQQKAPTTYRTLLTCLQFIRECGWRAWKACQSDSKEDVLSFRKLVAEAFKLTGEFIGEFDRAAKLRLLPDDDCMFLAKKAEKLAAAMVAASKAIIDAHDACEEDIRRHVKLLHYHAVCLERLEKEYALSATAIKTLAAKYSKKLMLASLR